MAFPGSSFLAKTIHQYYFETLGTLAAYGAPWRMCKKTLRFLNLNMAMPDIEGEIESQRRVRLATSGRFAYPDKSWLPDCIAANCQDTFVLHGCAGCRMDTPAPLCLVAKPIL
jgi:hypothetical protein